MLKKNPGRGRKLIPIENENQTVRGFQISTDTFFDHPWSKWRKSVWFVSAEAMPVYGVDVSCVTKKCSTMFILF